MVPIGMVVRGTAAALLVAHLVAMAKKAGLPSVGRTARRLVDEGMGGRSVSELYDLFAKDAKGAYAVLDRDRVFGPEPKDLVGRVVHRAKVLFHGITSQLSPARRLLFAASLLAAAATARSGLAVAAAVGFSLLLMLELVDRIRVRDELEVARQLQRDLLPQAAPEIDGFEVVHSYRTANEVGGDYYDFLPAADGRVALVVADASGHGIAAGLLMAITSATLRSAVDLDPDPEEVAAALHRTLVRTGDRRSFVTLFYALLDPEEGHLEHLSAGHPFPLLRRADDTVTELGQGSFPIGIRESSRWSKETSRIEPGETLMLYSDGLPEALGPDGEAFGFERLHHLLAEGGTPRDVHDRVLRAFDAHLAGEPLTDDLTLVVLGRTPQS